MGKLNPVGVDGEENGSIVGGGRGGRGQLLWEACVPGVWYGEKVEYDLAKTQISWIDNEKRSSVFNVGW